MPAWLIYTRSSQAWYFKIPPLHLFPLQLKIFLNYNQETARLHYSCMIKTTPMQMLSLLASWQQMLHKKYLGSKLLSQVQWKNGDSHFWASLMNVKRDFLRFGTFIIQDGSQVRFWEDRWLEQSTLREQYPCLYNIARHKQVSVAEVLSTSPPTLSWRRDLIGHKLVAWNKLLPRITHIVLSQHEDEFRWNLHPNG